MNVYMSCRLTAGTNEPLTLRYSYSPGLSIYTHRPVPLLQRHRHRFSSFKIGQVMNGASRPPDPELLGFLQTLVNESQTPSQQDRTDSDKENEQAKMQQEQQPGSSSVAGGASGNKGADDAMWDDFYNEEDFRPKQNERATPEDHRAVNEDYGRDRFESLERVEEEEEDDDDDTNNAGNQGKSGSGEDKQKQQEEESDSPASGPKPKKKKRFFTRVKRPMSAKNMPDLAAPTANGGSHPDLSGGQGDRGGLASLHNQQETMSETSGRGGRRLSRRKQVARPRCAGPEPGGDRLQQKYQELQMLMVRPLVEPGQYVQQTRQQLRRLEGLGRQHAQAVLADSLPPAKGSAARTGHTGFSHRGQHSNGRTAFVELSENNTEEGYSALRTVQVTNHAENRPRSAQHRKLRPSSAHTAKGRPLSANQARPARLPPASSSNNDRVLDYVTNSGDTRGAGRGKGRGKNSGALKSKAENGNGSKSAANTSAAETSESPNEVSTTSSGKNGVSEEEDSFDKGRDQSSSSDRSRSKSGSRKGNRSASSSPNRTPRHQTETHFKNSNNPALKKWLRRKEKEIRKKKKEERAQQLAEELTKQEEKRKRETLFQDSDKKVKEWMVRKKKEAIRQARDDRRRQREEDKEKEEREAIQQQYNSPFRLAERPQSAPSGQLNHHGRKLFIPIIRPERPIAGGNSNNSTQENATSNTPKTDGEGEEKEVQPIEPKIPRPPVASKFVYKRPVSGRVRLMKLQQEKKADAKRTELEKMLHEKKLADEKARKMRMSYDQWLIKKRSEDYEKRQEAARQRALAKSDPELERIVPEVARRRIENIQRGKRRVNTGEESLDSELNRSFGGGDFPKDGKANTYKLEVSGSSLKQRPSSAKASLNPRVSRSPRRPQSAHPRVKSVMEENHDSQKNAFKLPFPAENGAPKHVLARQEKLFAHHLNHPDPSSTQPDAQEQQQRTEENGNGAAAENSSKPATEEHTQAKTKDSNEEENDIEVNNASSFFVTEGNIPEPDNSEKETATNCYSFEESEETTEKSQADAEQKDKAEPELKQEGIVSEAEPASANVEDVVTEQGSDNNSSGNAAAPAVTDTDKSQSKSVEETEVQQDEEKTDNSNDGNYDESYGTNNAENNNSNTDTADDTNNEHISSEAKYDEENAGLESDAGVEKKGRSIDDDKNNEIEDDKEEAQETMAELEVRASRHSTKRVSFQEETQVYEPLDLGEDDQTYEDDNGISFRNESDDFEDDYYKEDNGNNDDEEEDNDDEEAEDERGNYFGDETPRDDEIDDF